LTLPPSSREAIRPGPVPSPVLAITNWKKSQGFLCFQQKINFLFWFFLLAAKKRYDFF
jgi:hypothetical protein